MRKTDEQQLADIAKARNATAHAIDNPTKANWQRAADKWRAVPDESRAVECEIRGSECTK